jgi:uncharacterized protein YlxW (UPF0749 family)
MLSATLVGRAARPAQAVHQEAPVGRPARGRRRPGRSFPLASVTIFALSGLLFATAAVNARGSDLRPAGGDVRTLLQTRADRVNDQRAEAGELRREIESISAGAGDGRLDDTLEELEELDEVTGLEPTRGEGVRVTLADAPRRVEVPGLDPNYLVVHQQDIQAYVNALWAGGARAVTLQGQRLISTTGIRCVGNTVVLDGVPYSPPYVIEAVGEQWSLLSAIEESPAASVYRDYAERYELGLDVERVSLVRAPAYQGSVDLTHARAVTP